MTTLHPNERWVIESGINHYQLIGPGRVWLKPWQRVLTKLEIGPQGQSLQFNEVRTAENVPLKAVLQVLYQVDPDLFTPDLLLKLPRLNEVGWQYVLKWRTEHTLRSLLAGYAWSELSKAETQPKLERRLTQTLADALKVIGLKITAVYLVKIELPADLQRTLLQTEQDGLEPRGRAGVLKEYFDLFGHNLPQAMPYIVQWELLNMLRKNGNPNLILTAAGLSLGSEHTSEPLPSVFQMQLPLATKGQ